MYNSKHLHFSLSHPIFKIKIKKKIIRECRYKFLLQVMSNNCLYRLSGRFSLLINLGVSLILLVDEFEIADRQICLQSIRRCGCFSSGLKWFFQSPVCPLRMKECPSLVNPDLISIVMLTDAFLEKLSTLTWSTNFSICSGVTVLPKKAAIFLISFLISCWWKIQFYSWISIWVKM